MLAWIAGALWMQTAAPTPTLAALETKTRQREKSGGLKPPAFPNVDTFAEDRCAMLQ